MKNGECPKCHSQAIYVSDGTGGGIGGHEHTLEVQNSGSWNTYDWQTLLCADCGYYENYLLDKRKLANIKANPQKEGWKKLNS